MPLEPGQKLSHYRLVEKIGEGGMGVVWKARDEKLRRDLALKVLPAELVEDLERRRRLLREARSAAAINHPNIGTVYEIDEAEGTVFIAMELVEGETLRSLLDGQALPIPETLRLATEIAGGLVAAHQASVIHRDLKPENIIIRPDGHVKILDFGLARVCEASQPADSRPSQVKTVTARMTREGRILGTPAYMSPEQARGHNLDGRSDVFSFGVTVFEMATGRPPFHGKTTLETLSAILNKPATPPSSLNAAVSPELERILSKCLEKEPRDRYQTTEDLAVDLVRLERQLVPGPSASLEATAKAAQSTSSPLGGRHRVLAMSVLVTTALLAAYYWWPGRDQERPDPAVPSTLPPPRVSPFLTGEASHKHPAWSPAGNLIAYSSDETDSWDIWICDSSAASPLNLTPGHRGVDMHPAWSPDGQRIAFYSDREGGGIYTMTTLGADVRRIAPVEPSVLYTFSLDWANSGELVFTNFDHSGSKQLYSVTDSTSATTCLTCELGVKDGHAGEMSPSGQLLVFTGSPVGPVADLWVGNLGNKTVMLLDDRGAGWPRFSPFGNEIFFASVRDGSSELWHIGIDRLSGRKSRQPVRLTSGLNLSDFSVSPDSSKVLVVRETSKSNLYMFDDPLARGLTFEMKQPLLVGEFSDQRPRWMPDGKSIVFVSNRRGSYDIWILPLAERRALRLTDDAGAETNARVNPSGTWITFDVEGAEGRSVQAMRPDGEGRHPVDPSWEVQFDWVCCTDWSPVGSRLVATFKTGEKERVGIVEINADTGRSEGLRFLEVPGMMNQYPRWSPHGTHVVFESFTEGSWDLWVAPVQGGSPWRLTANPGNERFAAWPMSSPFVYFLKERSAIWRIPVDGSGKPTGSSESWAEAPARQQFGVDGIDFQESRLAVSLVARSSDIWLVENFDSEVN